MKKILMTLTAAALTTAALSLPASAGQIGCDPSEDMASLKATQCDISPYDNSYVSISPAAQARAYAPRRAQVQAPQRSRFSSDWSSIDNMHTGVSGGSAN